MGIVSGVIGVVFHLNNMKLNDIAYSFKDGAKDLIGAALVVAMAQGIMQVLGGSDPTTPTVINTVMYGISQALSGLSGAFAAVLMYLFSPYLTSLSYQVLDKLQSPCRSWHHLLIFLVFPVKPLFLHSSLVMLSPT